MWVEDLVCSKACSKTSALCRGFGDEDTRGAAGQFVKEANLVFPVALDLNSTVKRAYRIFGPPATFFIDRQDVIRDGVGGPVSEERAREALKKAGAAITRLEKER